MMKGLKIGIFLVTATTTSAFDLPLPRRFDNYEHTEDASAPDQP
jgi:hypothetical protein